ncbi:MAG: 50S ribosomal protein L5, large subunit ribosomal protein L5 [Candidatus Peregrinibacteria bacterium GW2011_GWE2_39_6]|nr:MAG: 50S ribosomal protein L5, large subunit ribosomal protein L5 [Candidatus Peregrinibacteria bacterium GW2011_GWF2_39_17]KKR26545.1 MAG: 50S ribosomal protein L5, large subunit ribosomal protein L5 [Candidatus Peregrinibacteria bacterium GW2011_GWE2_39_6]
MKSSKNNQGKSSMANPKISKVTINIGIGSYVQTGDKNFEPILSNVAALTGQKPVVAKARKAISNFKLRIGMPVGVTVTLRGKRLKDFLSRLINIALPRIRDFRGISVRGFDGKGNYTLGIKEVTVFPEVNPDNINRNHGLQITIQTTAKTNRQGYELLKGMGFPFRDEVSEQPSKKA